MKLENKTCIVTDGVSGVGLEIAKTFAAAGAKLAIADIDAAMTAAAAAGSDRIGVEMDLTGPDAVQRGVEKIIAGYEGLDILVSSAGIQR